MVTEKDIPAIVQDVQRRLAEKGRERGLALELKAQDYRLEDNWLYLCVIPAQESVRPFDYAEILSEIEAELRQEGFDNVLLVPTLAE